MSNYQKIEFHDACDDLQPVCFAIQHSMGSKELSNWLTYMGEMPHIVKGSWALLTFILVEEKLALLLQDLITVVYLRTVPYSMPLHGANLIHMTESLSFDDLEQIASGQSRSFIPQKYETALAIAAKLATSDYKLRE